MFARNKKLWAVGAAALALAIVGTGAGITVATGGDDETPITGSALEEASQAALEHPGGGRATGHEGGSDEERAADIEEPSRTRIMGNVRGPRSLFVKSTYAGRRASRPPMRNQDPAT